jgi:hypothetical protein
MNEAVKTIDAPITGCGNSRNSAAYLGMKANMTRIAAHEKPIYRLVAPVAFATPTRLGELFRAHDRQSKDANHHVIMKGRPVDVLYAEEVADTDYTQL